MWSQIINVENIATYGMINQSTKKNFIPVIRFLRYILYTESLYDLIKKTYKSDFIRIQKTASINSVIYYILVLHLSNIEKWQNFFWKFKADKN